MATPPTRIYKRVRTAQILFIINAILWVVMGIITLTRQSENIIPSESLAGWVIFILMLINAAAMLAVGIALGRRQKIVYYIALMLLIINIILTVSDQFGLVDFISMVIDALLLLLLFVTRQKYSHT